MQFFSRYFYIWKFDKEQEIKYDLFVRSSQLASLRLVTFIAIFGMSLFLVIDSFKDVDHTVVLVTRSCVLAMAVTCMWLTYKNPGPNSIVGLVVLMTMSIFGSAMVTSHFAGMPPYYLTNLLFLIFVLVITASGLHFRYALFLNICCLLAFIIYSQLVHRDPFYYSQYPHLFSIFLYIHIVGIVLEGRRRKNYLQFIDLAEQKRLVEELNIQKNKIISILSHDVSAPMNSLSGVLYLYTIGGIDETELKTYIPNLREQLVNVSFLLHSLVRWSRSQMEGFVLNQAMVNIVEVLEMKMKLFQPQLVERNINLKLKADAVAFVKADADMLHIAFHNLLSNALKFGKNASVINLEVTRLANNIIRMSITNEGEPIAADRVKQLFTYQIESTADFNGVRGTGLGLHITAFFVRLNGGDIYLAPSEAGTITFCIEMPEAIEQTVSA